MFFKEFSISSNKKEQLVDITVQLKEILKESGIREGMCNVYIPHATAGIIINENADPQIEDDILKAFSNIVPENQGWKHDRIDNNATSHIKASIVGPSAAVPVKNGELQLGRWQDVFLADFDGPRKRRVIVAIDK